MDCDPERRRDYDMICARPIGVFQIGRRRMCDAPRMQPEFYDW